MQDSADGQKASVWCRATWRRVSKIGRTTGWSQKRVGTDRKDFRKDFMLSADVSRKLH